MAMINGGVPPQASAGGMEAPPGTIMVTAEEKQALEADRRAFEEEVLARWPAAALDDESKLEQSLD